MTFEPKNKKRRRTMRRNLIMILLFVAVVLQPVFAAAVTEEDFKARTTRNLLNLCTPTAGDPLAEEAIHFCHGYLLGAYAYYVAENSGPEGKQLVCLPKPEPTRNEAVAMFIKWAKARPQYLEQPPVETEFMFLIETWPCKK
jgi:hypothetical protein